MSPSIFLQQALGSQIRYFTTNPKYQKLSTAPWSWSRDWRHFSSTEWASPWSHFGNTTNMLCQLLFWGRTKAIFLSFLPLVERNKTPFLNSTFSSLALKKKICQNSHPAFLVTFFNSVGSMRGSLLLIGIPGGFALLAEEYLPRRKREGWRRNSEQESNQA